MKRTAGFPQALALLVLAIAACVAAALSLDVGPAHLPLGDVLNALIGGADDVTRAIVLDLRLPRAILALLVGGILGVAGAALQGLLRNPLVDKIKSACGLFWCCGPCEPAPN